MLSLAPIHLGEKKSKEEFHIDKINFNNIASNNLIQKHRQSDLCSKM